MTAGAKRLRPLLSAEVDYGPEQPSSPQIECLAKITALLCRHLELPITDETVLTHAEAAIADGYGPCSGDPEIRWDLWFLPDSATGSGIYPGGDIIRAKAAWYHIDEFINGIFKRRHCPAILLRMFFAADAQGSVFFIFCSGCGIIINKTK